MIAPTFEPESAPGAGIAAFDKGVDTSLSWMERSQQMRSRDQEEQLRRQQIAQNEILRPVHEAQALADVAKAHATVASAQLVQQYRQQAAVEAPQALADFLQITKIADLDEKAAALDAHAAKVAWLADIPEYKPLYDSIKDAQGKAHLDSIAMGKIAQAKDAVTQRAATAESQIEQRAKAAELQAKTAVEMQSMKAEMEKLKQEAESLRNEKTNRTRETVASTGAGARTTAATINSGARVQSSAGHVYAEEADALERAVQNEPDEEAKTILRRKAQAYRDKAEKALKGDAVAAAVVAPTHVTKDATTITVGGNTYPVFKDANGNRAYKVDDHFVPLTSD